MTTADIDNRFDYHAPGDVAREQHETIRAEVKALALRLNGILPESREKSLAFTHLEEVAFWSNAAIARS